MLYLQQGGGNIMKETNIDFKLEYDKEIIQKIRKKRKWLTLTSGIMLLSFLGIIVSFLTYSPIALLWSIIIFVVDLFVHLAIVGKINYLEQEGSMDMFTGTGFPD